MKIAVLVSGGVDSSVALAILKEKYGNNNIEAFYLKIWLEDELSYLGNCPWQEDLSYVQGVCEKFDVKLNILSLQHEYLNSIVSYTIEEIKLGRTPNPDLLCNQKIKFGAFFNKIDKDFDFVATGHYAQILKENDSKDNEHVYLMCSKDEIKDQTYFLSGLSIEQLKRAIFPIGHLSKDEVRTIAHKYDLPNKKRKDSQGLCFLGKIKFSDFIKAHIGTLNGDLIDYETGKILGAHEGAWFYTIGQRQGIGLSNGPWYVVSKDIKNNIVYVSSKYYAPDKERNSLIIESCNLLLQQNSKYYNEILKNNISNINFRVKLRHGAKFYWAKLIKLDENKYQIFLNGNDQGIASGQFAVIYYNNICILSGKIV